MPHGGNHRRAIRREVLAQRMNERLAQPMLAARRLARIAGLEMVVSSFSRLPVRSLRDVTCAAGHGQVWNEISLVPFQAAVPLLVITTVDVPVALVILAMRAAPAVLVPSWICTCGIAPVAVIRLLTSWKV